MTHPDDAFDFALHQDIEALIRVYCMRGMTRSEVIAELFSGNEMFAHGFNAICENRNIDRAELNVRVTAFIESEREEEAERIHRAIAEACAKEAV